MRPAETTARLAEFTHRGPGTDAERRSALWLAAELQADTRDARIETFWSRPNWALAHAWHVALGIAGSLVSVGSPKLGGVLILIALVSVIADHETGVSLGRRLTPEHASQNVVATPTSAPPGAVRLIITAAYDARRRSFVNRLRVRPPSVLGGWLAWLALALIWLVVIAVLRNAGHKGTSIAVAQFPPTVALVIALALLVELATADFSANALDTATATAVAIAITRALDAAAPGNLAVELVLQGSGGLGLRHYLRKRRRQVTAQNTVVLGIGPSVAGSPRWWTSDGPLVPLRYFAALNRLCAQIAADEPGLHAAAYRGRGTTPALLARAARLPATTIGTIATATTDSNPDPNALDAMVEFGLMLTDAIDAYVGRARAQPARTLSPGAIPA